MDDAKLNSSNVNPNYSTIWAVVMPYNKMYRKITGERAWVRLLSVRSTAEQLLEKMKVVALTQGEGEPYLVNAELLDWTLPSEIDPRNIHVCINLENGWFSIPDKITPDIMYCEKYVICYDNGPTIPHMEYNFNNGDLLLKFSVPMPKYAKTTDDAVDACTNMLHSVVERFENAGWNIPYQDITNRAEEAVSTANRLIIVDPDGSGAFMFASEQDKADWVQIDEYGLFREKEAIVNG